MNLPIEEFSSTFALIMDVLRNQPNFDNKQFQVEIRELFNYNLSKTQQEIFLLFFNYKDEKQYHGIEDDIDLDENDIEEDFPSKDPDPFENVDWGNPSTFNQAAWDQF